VKRNNNLSWVGKAQSLQILRTVMSELVSYLETLHANAHLLGLHVFPKEEDQQWKKLSEVLPTTVRIYIPLNPAPRPFKVSWPTTKAFDFFQV
jgi:hypothetical protein